MEGRIVVCADDYRARLRFLFDQTTKQGAPYVDVRAGDLYRESGAKPEDRQMPNCCSVMKQEATDRAEILPGSPPSLQGANLAIRYLLPR
jgi:hypothetical protein